jgi:hypothetical protein
MCVDMSVYTVSILIYNDRTCRLRESRSKDTSGEAKSYGQVLVSNAILQKNEPRVLGEMAD